MIDNIKKILISFGAGLGIGILSGKVYYEKKYRMKLKGETFNSDKEKKSDSLYSPANTEEKKKEEVKADETKTENSNPKESSEINKNKDDLSSLAKKVKEENPRVDYSTPTPAKKRHEVEPNIDEDFELEPDDFGELGDEDYEEITVLWLADGNLVYENGTQFEPVEEPRKKIGNKAWEILMNNPVQDVIYVRNKRLKIDYEIIVDDRTLSEGISDEDDEDEEYQD